MVWLQYLKSRTKVSKYDLIHITLHVVKICLFVEPKLSTTIESILWLSRSFSFTLGSPLRGEGRDATGDVATGDAAAAATNGSTDGRQI